MKQDIKNLSLEELTAYMKEQSLPQFRAGQVYGWLHEKMVPSFSEMKNVPRALRDKLQEEFSLEILKPVEQLVSKEDGTRKFLFALGDHHIIESVFMIYHHGVSVCISTQVGCRMGCKFCASTLDGLVRNLQASEMLEQIYRIQQITGQRVSHVVLMGAGEPMDNYEQVIRFVRLITSENGQHLSARNITISTCGIVPRILDLAEEGLPVTLALSLHAPSDAIRRNLMPVAKVYTLQETLRACDTYFSKTGRRVTLEYSLVRGVNDTLSEAERLATLLENRPYHINLIPVNPIKERDYLPAKDRNILEFKKSLEKKGIHVTIRREMGRDIQGACGQLRRSYLTDNSPSSEQ